MAERDDDDVDIMAKRDDDGVDTRCSDGEDDSVHLSTR